MPVVKYKVGNIYQKKIDNFKDGWDMEQVIDLLKGNPATGIAGFIDIYTDWEDLGFITDLRTGKRLQFDFKRGAPLPLNNSKVASKGMRALSLNVKTIEWLGLAIDFNYQMRKFLNKVKGLPLFPIEDYTSVSAFISAFINESARNFLKQSYKKEIGGEEKKA